MKGKLGHLPVTWHGLYSNLEILLEAAIEKVSGWVVGLADSISGLPASDLLYTACLRAEEVSIPQMMLIFPRKNLAVCGILVSPSLRTAFVNWRWEDAP